jgi:hypothetical protein
MAEDFTEIMVIQVTMHKVIGVLLVMAVMIILVIIEEQAKVDMIQKAIIVVLERVDMITVGILDQDQKVGL